MKPLVLAAAATLTSLCVAVWAFGDGHHSQTPPATPANPGVSTTPLCVVYAGTDSCGDDVNVPCDCITMPPIECPDGTAGSIGACTGGFTSRYCWSYKVYEPADEGSYAHWAQINCCDNYACLSEGGCGAGICFNTCTGFNTEPCGTQWVSCTHVYVLVSDGGCCNVRQTK